MYIVQVPLLPRQIVVGWWRNDREVDLREVLMIDNLETLLQSGIGRPVTVYLLTDGSTGRTGSLERVGVDYLLILDDALRASNLIPFNAIAMIVPAQALS